MSLSALLLLLLGAMGITPGDAVQAASLPAYEVLPALDAGVDKPAAVAVDAQGRIYVAETANNRLRVFSQGGDLLAQILGLAAPKSVTVDVAGNIFVGSQSQGSVTVFDRDRNLLGKFGTGDGEFENPMDIDLFAGQVYVTDKGSGSTSGGSIRIYDASRQQVGSVGTTGNGDGQLWHPCSLAIDAASGEMAILDRKQIWDPTSRAMVDGARLQFFGMDGTFLRAYDKFGYDPAAGQLRMPVQLTADAASRVYVTDSLLQKVMVYDNAGTYLGAIDGRPQGLSMSAAGRLYVTNNYFGRIDVFGIDNYSAMGVKPAVLSYTAIEGGAAPALQDAIVVNSGKAEITWTASATADWVSLPAPAGTLQPAASGTLGVEVRHDGLAPGSYQGTVQVAAPGMEETVTVNLTVNPNPLQVSPAGISLTIAEGSTPPAQTLSIGNTGSEPLNWSATAAPAWLTLSKIAGSAPNTVKVYADASGLAVGGHSGVITFLNLAGGEGVDVPVNLTITEAAAPPTDPPDLPLPGGGETRAGGLNWRVNQAAPGKVLRGVWGSSYRDLLAVGDRGTILSFNGKEWTAAAPATGTSLQSVWGNVTRTTRDIHAVGDNGLVLRQEGTSWNPISVTTSENLADLWGVAGEVMIAGSSGTILNLTRATAANEGTVLRSIWGSSPANVYAVGENGMVLHSDGVSWTAMVSDTNQWLNAVWGDPRTGEVFAVGENGAITHFDGMTWNSMVSGIAVALHGVYGTESGVVYAVGDNGVVLRYDGAAWNVLLAGGVNLRDIWVDDRVVVAVGDDGTILTGSSRDVRGKKKSRASNPGLLSPSINMPATR